MKKHLQNMGKLLGRNILSTSAVIWLMWIAAFAAAPGGGYFPWETLDPDCAPWDVNCVVSKPLFDVAYTDALSDAITCPTGFINVPNRNLCVAQYEMSYDETTPSDVTGWTDWNTRKYNVSKTPVSMPDRLPVTEITQPQAITSCESMGARYHLITNDEWMAVARNIENNPNNWSNGMTWSGYISNGVSNEIGNSHWCAWKQDGVKWAWVTGSDCDWTNRNRLELSNGEYIYDLAGNVWEHVNKANTLDGKLFNSNDFNTEAAEWWNGWKNWESLTFKNGYSHELFWPRDPSWWASEWMWRLYNYNRANNIFLRGGSAHNASGTGVFALLLNWHESTQGRDVGFRCAYVPQ